MLHNSKTNELDMKKEEVKAPDNIQQYQSSYNEDDFWSKVKNFAKLAGKEVIRPALLLYYTLKSKNTPTRAKAIIMGALGYFILPIDLIADFIPVMGLLDDAAALSAAVATVGKYITDDISSQADDELKKWFNEQNK